MQTFNAQIFDADELQRLQAKYPGGVIVYSLAGYQYYRVSNVNIAELPSSAPSDSDKAILLYIAYAPRLVSLGYDNLVGYGIKTSFEGEIDPSGSFKYLDDYQLGDIVTIRNSYGISAAARIIEVDEVHDDTGYRVLPKFEYIS